MATPTLDDLTALARAYGDGRETTGATSRQPEVDELLARIDALSQPTTPPPPTDPHPIPSDAVIVHPNGSDTNPGTTAKPRLHPIENRPARLLAGEYPGWSWYPKDGTSQTLHVAPGDTVVLEGRGKVGRALTLGGRTDLFGDLRVNAWSPTYTTDPSCSAVYFGGTAAGSQVDGLTISNSGMCGLGTQVPLVLTKVTVVDAAYSGILGTLAHGTVFGDVTVRRVNRSKRAQDGQLGAIKMTRSNDLWFTRGVLVEDTGGAQGIWTDVSCLNAYATGARVLTAGGKPAEVGIHFEEAQGGVIFGCEAEGLFAMQLLAAGGVRVLFNKATGTSVALNLQQDRPRNDGSNPANLPGDVADWWTVNNFVDGNQLVATAGARIALMGYAHGGSRYPGVTGKILGKDMFDSMKGNVFGGSLQLGGADGQRTTYSTAQLAGVLGSRFSTTPPPMPAYLAALVA